MFHVKDGLYFERLVSPSIDLDTGEVKIYIYESAELDSKLIQEYIIDPYTWASIVSVVSYYEDSYERWKLASKFHNQ
ncbi:MAG: hypothetical protein AABY07_08980 [Nanoarchaeota archaeon]